MVEGKFLKDPKSIDEYIKISLNYPYFVKNYKIKIHNTYILDQCTFDIVSKDLMNTRKYVKIDSNKTYVNNEEVAICYKIVNRSKTVEIFFFTAGHEYPRYVYINRIS